MYKRKKKLTLLRKQLFQLQVLLVHMYNHYLSHLEESWDVNQGQMDKDFVHVAYTWDESFGNTKMDYIYPSPSLSPALSLSLSLSRRSLSISLNLSLGALSASLRGSSYLSPLTLCLSPLSLSLFLATLLLLYLSRASPLLSPL